MPDKYYIDNNNHLRLVPQGKEQKFLSKYPGSREATRKELSDFEDRRAKMQSLTAGETDIQTNPGNRPDIFQRKQPLTRNIPQNSTGLTAGTPGLDSGIRDYPVPAQGGLDVIPGMEPPKRGKPLSGTVGSTMQKMPAGEEAMFEMSVDRYRQEKDYIDRIKSDNTVSENVKQSLINGYQNNIRTSGLTVEDTDLPPAAKQWLERNKVVNKIASGYDRNKNELVYTDVLQNTPEQIAFIKDYIANSGEGKRYAQAHRQFIEGLESEINPLLNQIEAIRETSGKNREEYAKRHNINTWSLKGTNYRNDALLDKASNLLKNTKLLLSANREGGGFLKGLHMTNEDLKELAVLTESFYNDKALNRVIDKYQKDPDSLSEEEKIIIQAKYITGQISAGVDPGSRYNIGQATKQSLPFMRDFILTAPVGGAAANVVKGGASALAAKTGANLLLSRGIGGTAGNLAKGAIDLSVRPAVQTMFSPSSYAMAYREMQGQAASRDGQGNILFGNRKTAGHGMASAFIENQSEVLGEVVLDKLFRKFKIPAPAFLKTNAAKRLGSATGIQGPVTEYAEEKYADLANIVRGEQTIEGFLDPRQNLETFGAVAVMQIPFSAISGTGYGIGKIRDVQAKRAIRRAYDRSADNLNAYFGQDAGQAALAFSNLVDNSSEEELKRELLSVLEDDRLDDNGKRAIVEYVTSYSAYSGLNKAKQEDIAQVGQQITQLVGENINPQMNAVVSATIAGNESPVQLVGGNIVQREDGSIDREASDKQVFYIDAQGNRQVTAIGFVEGIAENIPVQDAVARLTEMETANILSRQENEEIREYQPGETVTADILGNGITFTGEVTGTTPSGNYIIVNPTTGEQVEAEPRRIIDQDNIRGVENGSLVEYRNGKGETVEGTVNDAYGLRPQGMMDIDGNVVPVTDVIGLSGQLTVSSQQPAQESDNLKATAPENANNLQATGQQNRDVTAEEQDNLLPTGRIPEDEKGNLLFEQVPVEATVRVLGEVYNDIVELLGVVDATISNTGKQIDKAKSPKPTGDINKDIANKRAANKQLEELNSRLSYWQDVRKAIQAGKPVKQQITEQLSGQETPIDNERTNNTATEVPGQNNSVTISDISESNTAGGLNPVQVQQTVEESSIDIPVTPAQAETDVNVSPAKDVEPLEAENQIILHSISNRKKGDVITDIYSGVQYEIIEPERRGLSTLRETATGETRTTNPNDRRYYTEATGAEIRLKRDQPVYLWDIPAWVGFVKRHPFSDIDFRSFKYALSGEYTDKKQQAIAWYFGGTPLLTTQDNSDGELIQYYNRKREELGEKPFNPGNISVPDKIAEPETNTNPTESQEETGSSAHPAYDFNKASAIIRQIWNDDKAGKLLKEQAGLLDWFMRSLKSGRHELFDIRMNDLLKSVSNIPSLSNYRDVIEAAGDRKQGMQEESALAYGSSNTLIPTEKYEELKKRMRDKLNNLNSGFDPELFTIGTQMAMYHIEAGARKFADFAGRMIEDLGGNIRPFLKSFYEGARQMPGMETLREEMDSFNTVNSFDVDSIGKEAAEIPIRPDETDSFAGVLADEILSFPDNIEKYFNNDGQKRDIAFDTMFGSAMLNHRKEHIPLYKQFVENEDFSRELKNRVRSLLDGYGDKKQNQKPVTGNTAAAEPVEADTRLNDKPYSTEGITADYPIDVLSRDIKKDVEKFVKAIAKFANLDFDTDRKGKKETCRVNIAPAGGEVTFILWSRLHPGIGVYVSIPYRPDYGGNGYDNYRIPQPANGFDFMNRMLWRLTTRQDKYRGLDNHYVNPGITAKEFAGIIVKELNNYYLRSGLDTEKAEAETAVRPAGGQQPAPAFDAEKPLNGTDILNNNDFIKDHIVVGKIPERNVQSRQDSNNNNAGRLPDGMRQSAGGMDDRAPAGGTVPDDAGRYAERLPEQNRTGRDEGGKADDKQRHEPGRSRVPGNQQSGTTLRPDGDGRAGTGGRTAEPREDTGSGGIPGDLPVLNLNNFRIGDTDNIVPKGVVSKIRANIKAIGLLKKLEEEGRDATDDEKQIFSQYSGWGGLAEVLNTTRKGDSSWQDKYGEYHDKIISLLTPEEFTAAENSTINAHYTDGGIAGEMWKLAGRLGFKGGKVLEPALGTGNFFGLMPEHLSQKSSLRAYELDSITGRIASKLYPDARIQVKGYEESRDRDIDLIITNVPFGQKAPYDSSNKDICDFSLHNYFIAKGIRQLAPGGLGLFITSKSTMDSAASAKFREWATTKGHADLIGAIRLPNNAFSENAGTEVTTDILVFRKRDSETPSPYARDFRFTGDIKEAKMKDGSPTVIEANEYFAQNPNMMLGELKLAYEDNKGGLYSGNDVTLAPHKGQDLIKALDEAIQLFPADISAIENANFNEKAESGEKEGTMVDRDGHIYEVVDGELAVPGWINENTTNTRNKKVPRVTVARHYLRIKDVANSLMDAEREDRDDIEGLRNALNREYDSFYNEYGRLNNNVKLRFLVDTDVEYNTVFALEKVKKIKEVDSRGNEKDKTIIEKADIFSKRILFPVREPVHAGNIADALEISLSYRGRLDMNFIAELTGLSVDEAKEKLKDEGLAFTNPSTGLPEDKDTYLSGYVRSKYYDALEAAKTEPEFERNVKALESVVPEDIPGTQIKIRLGSTFIPDKYYEEFVGEKLKIGAKIAYRPELNKYVVQPVSGKDSAENKTTYGTSHFSGIQLLEKGLNLKQPVAFDIVYEGGQPKRIKNQEKTAEAQAMLSTIADLFVNYIYDKEQAMSEIERIYNDRYNDYVEKSYSVPGIEHYPGANRDITLRQHQKRAVSRGLRDSVLLAHQVGTGKTFTKITIAMEMRRLGIAKKPVIAVQNATLEQYVASFKTLYPGANILAPTKKMMDAKNRTRLFSLIAYGDYDAVIIPHSFLYMIPDDPQRQRDYLNEQIAELQNVLSGVNEDQDRVLYEELTRKIDQLQESLEEIDNPDREKKGKKGKKVKDKARKQLGVVRRITRQADRKTDNVLTFEKMGVDALIIDEAHNFKRLGLITKMASVKGIDTSGSKRAYGVYMKVRYIHERTGGRNVVFATGTPITNTMAEAWTMMRYIEPDVLEKYDIGSFDRFATTFGSVEPSLEFTATGNFKVVDRFKSFINAPELFTAFRVKTDVVLTEDIPEFKEGNTIPKLKNNGFTQVIVPQSDMLEAVMDQLKDKIKQWENLSPREKRKHRSVPLVVFGRARQAAIDLRLINPDLPDDPGSKTNRVIAEIKRIYDTSRPYRGTQLIFCDLFQSSAKIPGSRFNLYEDIKKKLIALGIPEHEVAIIHDYDEKNRERLFERVNEGLVRIVIGNTEKMGVGVNMQKRAVALHHIDAPARPMDFEQRNGRILRQGNLHAQMGIPVEVLTYGVEKTLDATAYQRLAIKQAFINQVMKGDNLDREISDEAEEDNPSDMNFMQMMAVLSGSKYAQLHFLKSAELKKLETAEKNHLRRQVEINKQIKDYEVYKEYKKVDLETLNQVKSLLDTYFPDGKITSVTINGKKQTEKLAVAIDEDIDNYKKAFVSALKTHEEMPSLEIRFNDYPQAMELDYTDLINDSFRYFYKVGDSAMKGTVQSGAGLLNSLRSRIGNIPGDIKETEDKIAFYETNIPVLRSELLKPFDKAEKLEALRKEIAEIAEKMKGEAVTKEKEPSPTAKAIDSSMIDLEAAEEPEDSEAVSYSKYPDNKDEVNDTDYASNEEEEESGDTGEPDVKGNPEPEGQEGIIVPVTPYKHTQTGRLLYLARINEQVSAAVFSDLKSGAKNLGGSWSRFAKGFLFEEESKANKFRNEVNNGDGIRRQASLPGGFKAIPAGKFGRLIDKLNRTGLAVEVVLDEDIRNNPEIRDTQGNMYGYVTPDGIIHLDATRMNANTPVHEFGHLWNSFVKENNPGLWAKGVELIRQSPYYWERIYNNPAYSNLPEEMKIDEALAMAIGDKGERFVNRNIKQRFVDWLSGVWKSVKEAFGISTHIAVEDMSLSDFTDRAVRDLLGGERLTNTFVQPEATRMQSVNDLADTTNSAMTEEVRNQLDGRLKNFRFRIREAWEDRYLAVKEFLDILRNNGTEVAEYNDYYKQATHINGKIDAQLEYYNEKFQKPLNKAIGKLEKAGVSYRDIENYAILKHGLERNKWMKEDAVNRYMEKYPEATPQQTGRFEAGLPDDFSGITAVEKEVGMHAEGFIHQFETGAGAELIHRFWKSVRNATLFSIGKQLEGGLIDKKTYDSLASRYDYYIPLRGHDDETAEDRWDYSPNMGTYFVAPLIKAKGRKTRSESPFAFIFSMAQSAIGSSNRNIQNQTILRLAQKDRTGLLGVDKAWYMQTRLNEDGVPVYEVQAPAYSDNTDQYRKNIEEFEVRMQQLQEQGLAVQNRGKLDTGGLFIKKTQAGQHVVYVSQNGVEYAVYINGNPAVARAINGINAKDLHKDLRFIARISRQMASNFTTRNPIFVATNFSRDYIFASSILPVKEDAKYAIRFQRNIPRSAGALQRYIRGKADLSGKADRYVIEYIMNGGKTGFSHIVELDTVRRKIEREIKKGDSKNVFRTFLDFMGDCNEFAENLSRLSVFITSREQGRSITQSISDAKEVTVNFNRNGAGGYGAAWFRSLYLFVNAGIQALSNFAKVAQKNKGKTAMLISSYAMSGVLMPLLTVLIGGDDGLDEYMKLSDWERQNNLCIYTGSGFIKIPLPHELRVFHAMGDNIFQAVSGKKDITQSLLDTILGFSDLIPANPAGAIQGSWAELMPDMAKPPAQLAANKNFTGSRITNEWADPAKPGYLRIRTNKKGEPYAPAFLVKLTQLSDNATGGDGVEKGIISFNPDEVNHLIHGYSGGLYTTGMQILDMSYKAYDWTETGELKLKVRETPLRTFYTSESDLMTAGSGLNSRYFKIADDMQETRRKVKGYKEQAQKGDLTTGEFAAKISRLTPDIEKYKRIYPYIKQVKKYESALKDMEGEEQKEAERMISELKQQVVEADGI
ncbi:hypothetical protein IR083_19885 [Dysgonomonas sp. GY75]|uniref:LPD38 domain-containing protein n=1 Tax=Dysgonomonas sp. GY75 TaxID=2780419 RepID=UPI001883F5EA|nr:LPD38 domain-containing protein [Dysgonomonas sp. GY75]MBF0651081.1 hypothetical protein [Dysgonomonas sp. GY75]